MASAKEGSPDPTSQAVQLRVEESNEEPLPPPSSYLDQAFRKAVANFAGEGMPSVMHGSGDVEPARVDPAAAHFLASLTAQYTAKLVDAAVDTFAMFLNQNDQPFQVPPPRFAPPHHLPAPPRPLMPAVDPSPVIILQGRNNEPKPPRAKPKRKMRADYWDEPLPEPKIRRKTDDGDSQKEAEDKDPPIEKWTGLVGVDVHADSIRRAHMPLGLSTPNFVFPICQDVYAYGRVRHVQAFKRSSVEPLLQDHCIPDVLRDEKAARFHADMKDKKGKGEESDDDELVDPASWPDVESLLLPGYPPFPPNMEKK